jgi:ribonuclease G
MQNEILINATPGETRVAILEKGQLLDLHIERATTRNVVSNVVMGRVTRVLPGMQAAFVDIGLEKAAFLYAGDYVEDIERLEGEEGAIDAGPRRRRGGRRAPPDIGTLLQEGQEILVQIAKEPIGTKGARITSHVSIAGRHLVLTPWAQRVGVSRRIDSDRERRRLRDAVERIRPRDLGFIIRTAGEGTREADLEADVRYLTKVWDDIQIRKGQVRAPAVLYSEPELPLRVIRDFANGETRRIAVDSRPAYEKMKAFIEEFVAEPRPRLELYEGAHPIFDHYDVEPRIDANLGRKVWLKSGGYLIIDQSEALTAIDVNTGRYVGKHDLEETVLRTNLEAVKEVVYQLRFRNIGGLIIIDLIDMEPQENREKVYRALQEALRQDKAKTNILKISELGLVEMTRKRTRESLVQTLCEPCSYCEGKGYVLSEESVAFKVLREIRKAMPRFAGRRLDVTLSRRVAEQLLGPCRESLRALEAELGREIEIHVKPELHQEQFEIRASGEAGPVKLDLPWLRAGRAAAAATAAADVAELDETEPDEAADEPEPDGDAEETALGSTEPDEEASLEAAEALPRSGRVSRGADGEAPEALAATLGAEPLAAGLGAEPMVAALGGDAPAAVSPAGPGGVASPRAVDAVGESTILPGSDPKEP